jgi:hypothetical protein
MTGSPGGELLSDPSPVTVTVRGTAPCVIDRGSVARFGRSSRVEAVIGRDPEDLLVSRTAGYVDHRSARVRIANTSTSGKLLRVVPPSGPPVPLAPAALWSAPVGMSTIEVPGRVRTWLVDVSVMATEETGPPSHVDGEPETDLVADLSDDERDALAAVCAPLLRVPAQSQPNGYAEAARLVPGASAKAIERRLDKLAERLLERGTPGLAEGRWRLGSLAQLAVHHGLVVPADLDLLRARAT